MAGKDLTGWRFVQSKRSDETVTAHSRVLFAAAWRLRGDMSLLNVSGLSFAYFCAAELFREASFAIEPGDSSSVFELDGSSQVEEASDSAFDIAIEDSSSQDSSLSLEDGSGSEIMALDDSVADVSGIAEDIALEDGSGSEVVPVEEEGDINAGTLATPSRSSKATQLIEVLQTLKVQLTKLTNYLKS